MQTPLLFAALAASALTASAQVLMFDFGPTTTTATTNSPYHTANNSFTDGSWNQIGTADPGSLVYSNGATATGISLNLGGSASNATLGTIALATQPSNSSALNSNGATATTAGVYAGTSVGKDGIFHANAALSSPARNVGSVGLQISGLAAGTYDIYLTGRNTNLTSSSFSGGTFQLITGYAGASGSSGDFAFGSYASGSNTFTSVGGSTAAWVAGENYIKLTVTLGANEFLNIATSGAGSTGGGTTIDQRGFLNSLQIVPVAAIPEPSSCAVVAGALAVSAASLRRRRRA